MVFQAEVGPQALSTTTEEEGSASHDVLVKLGIPHHMKATISSRVSPSMDLDIPQSQHSKVP